jgi:hypothetical protein
VRLLSGLYRGTKHFVVVFFFVFSTSSSASSSLFLFSLLLQ